MKETSLLEVVTDVVFEDPECACETVRPIREGFAARQCVRCGAVWLLDGFLKAPPPEGWQRR